MSDYRRYFVPGGTYFLTLVTYRRQPLFTLPENVTKLREAITAVQQESPFEFLAGVVLPDHMHFIWTLRPGDRNYSKRIGRLKVCFTRSLPSTANAPPNASRIKHRESAVWQRRFWEHTIDDSGELDAFLDYIHYNPVKHGLAACPHEWAASSFAKWVAAGLYEEFWGCCCKSPCQPPKNIAKIEDKAGEP